MMANILGIVGRSLCVAFSLVIAGLAWKTVEYFNKLPETDTNKPLIAWDTLMLFCMLIFLVVRLIMA